MTSTSKKIGWKVAAALVIANMIGTGVFTSLGFQLVDTQNSWSIVILWVLGGVMALIGALCYAEVGSAFPESGGEYVFLSRLYHPFLGYLAGWVSLFVGFAAPVALAAMQAIKQAFDPLNILNPGKSFPREQGPLSGDRG